MIGLVSSSQVELIGIGEGQYRCRNCSFIGSRDRERLHPARFQEGRTALAHILAHKASGHLIGPKVIPALLRRMKGEK